MKRRTERGSDSLHSRGSRSKSGWFVGMNVAGTHKLRVGGVPETGRREDGWAVPFPRLASRCTSEVGAVPAAAVVWASSGDCLRAFGMMVANGAV